MKRHAKRILAVVLVCLTALGTMPLAALADSMKIYSPQVFIDLAEPPEDEPDGDGEGEGEEEPPPVEADTYTVSFYVYGTLYHEAKVDPDTLVSWPEPPEMDENGLPFLSWYAEGEDAPFSPYRLITGDTVLNARFSEDHLITFFDTDGQELEVIELPAGQGVPEPTATPTLSMGEMVSY